MVKVCVVCGKEFDSFVNNQKTCSPVCRKANEERVWHERYERLKMQNATERVEAKEEKNNYPIPHKKREKKKKLSIEDIAIMARAEHLSYGQFVAKYGI